MRSDTLRKILCAIAAGFIACAGAEGQNGVEYFWSGMGDGTTWTDPDNWVPNTGAPVNGEDIAFFDSGAETPHQLVLDRNVTYGALIISNDSVVLDMQGYTNTVTLGITKLSTMDAQDGFLRLVNGEFIDNHSLAEKRGIFEISYGTSTAELELEGEGAILRSANHFRTTRGKGKGYLRVLDGAQVYFDYTLEPINNGYGNVLVSNATLNTGNSSMYLGRKARSGADIVLMGERARWYRIGSVSTLFVVGYSSGGTGSLTVKDGARVTSGTPVLSIGHDPTTGAAPGVVTVEGRAAS